MGIGVLAPATAAVALRTGLILPRWLAIVTLVVGITVLTPVSRVNVVSGASLLLITLIIAVALLRTPVEQRPGVSAS